MYTLKIYLLTLKILSASSEFAPELEEDIREFKGVSRLSTSVSIQGRKSPVASKKSPYKYNGNSSITTSPKKVSTSFANEPKSMRFSTDMEMDNSMVSQGPTTNEKKKIGQLSKIAKEFRQMSPTPSLTAYNFSEKNKSPVNDSSTRGSVAKVKDGTLVKDDSQKFKVMKFDFDDEDHTPKSEYRRVNSNANLRQKEGKTDFSKIEEIKKAIE